MKSVKSKILNKAHHIFHQGRSFVTLVVRLYFEKSCQKSAGALTYMTLFAIVPLLTVCYSMFSIIPAFNTVGDQFQGFIFSQLLPSNEQLIVKYLNDFSNQARKLTAVGVLFLVISAYLMLKNIEKNFNAIWNVPFERRGVANFLLYWAVLSLGPLLLGLALGMKTYVLALQSFVGHYDPFDFVDYLFEWLPWLLTGCAFTLLFVAVPNCKVRLSHAAIGGFLTLMVFELIKAGFTQMVAHSDLKLIYGAFAVVPLFLMWINLSWMIILGGAVVVRGIGLFQVDAKDRGYPDFFGCLLVLWQFHKASEKGESIANHQLLQLGLSTDQWQRIREVLLNGHVIATTQQNEFVLSRDLARLSLQNVKNLLGENPRMPLDQTRVQDLPWFNNAQQLLGELDALESGRLSLSVEDFFEAIEKG